MFGQSTMFHLPPSTNGCKIELVDGALAVTSPYSPEFVAALKAVVPSTDRKWDGQRKQWLVSPAFGSQLQRLLEQHYNATVSIPQVSGTSQSNEMRLIDVRYIGAAKTREDGQETAFGWSNGGWSVIFPKSVLLEWFGQTSRPDEAQTLYGVLGVSQSVDAVELKKAWKRLARTWHPDVSREPGSREQFQAIQEAYEVLGDTTKRAKYNAGLQFEAMSKTPNKQDDDWLYLGQSGNAKVYIRPNEWRAPLRCGLILVEGQSRLGRFVVSRILQWADITNSRGDVLVTTWAKDDDKFTEAWVAP